MLAWIDAYHDMLRPRALALGESPGEGRNYDMAFALPMGGIPLAEFAPTLIVLMLAAAFYYLLVPGRTGQFALLTLAYPALVLFARLAQGFARKSEVTV
jgi:hypothetical protein